ncbi:uncharacterized protein Z518_11349 [Rhinocladiella mackenziei CBS 650.93]|uniref:Uncharacterized protein n=1 Tax=Rhinocladiella mackenziei CBS 650.93 TaxID=1442369 RepID=A0A0D2FB80_9EURO|nr:uncharacterized protein Z518_11349 [Rhinocladiella mackenziei CBS 650.93]KIW99361.1 hypothetical protein Z518_11349 [Rhinocladiella mackenziei CBS 650.93]
MTESLLSPFNGQLDLRDAYNWSRKETYEFLEDVVSDPNKYGVLLDRVDELKSIRGHLLRLSHPDGADFRAGSDLSPDQHIYRVLNPAWRGGRGGQSQPPPQPPGPVSKFSVMKHIHNGSEYWSPFDLLGHFLSFMGPAPDSATKRNFYLPMTAVYGRWCRLIAGTHPRTGICDIPYMFQCTWCTPLSDSSKPTRFFLGSSLAGYNWTPQLTGTWEYALKYARFVLVDGNPLQQAGYNFENSPMIERKGTGSTRFGNCAETYPFLDLLIGHNPAEETCYGLALQQDFVYIDDYQDMCSGVVWKSLCNPCDNCSETHRMGWCAALIVLSLKSGIGDHEKGGRDKKEKEEEWTSDETV